jgi:hypothetical protein
VTCTATDLSQNTTRSSFTVTVIDTTAPVLTGCPENQSATTLSNSAVVVWTAPTALDACAGTVAVVCDPVSGSDFAIGTTAVECAASDPQGNTNHCAFNVVVTAEVQNLSLTITEDGDKFVVSWPKPSPAFVLQVATTLEPGAEWTDYSDTVTDNDTTYSASFDKNGQKFFRLRRR